jgi:hypothetical protein
VRNTISEQLEIVDSLDGGGFIFYLVKFDNMVQLVAFQKNVIFHKYKLSKILDVNESDMYSFTIFSDGIEHYLIELNKERVNLYSHEPYFWGSYLYSIFLFFAIVVTQVLIAWRARRYNRDVRAQDNGDSF